MTTTAVLQKAVNEYCMKLYSYELVKPVYTVTQVKFRSIKITINHNGKAVNMVIFPHEDIQNKMKELYNRTI